MMPQASKVPDQIGRFDAHGIQQLVWQAEEVDSRTAQDLLSMNMHMAQAKCAGSQRGYSSPQQQHAAQEVAGNFEMGGAGQSQIA